jgi:hypothetical protein
MGSISCIPELVLTIGVFFMSLWSRMKFVVEIMKLVGAYLIFWEPPAPVVRSVLQ